jgi:phosphomevalonate kinase
MPSGPPPEPPPAATAPGKQLLAGEYAVLHGAPAVVAAVDRRAFAWLEPPHGGASPLVAAAREETARALGEADAAALPPVRVETRGFSRRGRKLGLGSSAAVVTAACGALFAARGRGASASREEIFRAALGAHRLVQGGRGSGVDVAASVFGGVLVYRMGEAPIPVPAEGPPAVFVWTETPASTVGLVAAVEGLARSSPAVHQRRLAELCGLADELAAAWLAGDRQGILTLTGDYGKSMERLGQALRLPVVPVAIARLARLAERHGGAAKPSGAGGGDTAVAVFPDEERAAAFAADCRTVGLVILDLQVGAPGLRTAEQP